MRMSKQEKSGRVRTAHLFGAKLRCGLWRPESIARWGILKYPGYPDIRKWCAVRTLPAYLQKLGSGREISGLNAYE